MSVIKFIRNADAVKSTLREVGDQLIAVKGCKVYVPARFLEKLLAQLSPEKYICGICAIVVDGNFGLLSVNAMVGISPTSTNHVEFNGDEYLEFVFDPGAALINNLNLVKADTLTYRIYDEFLANGRIPWYLPYEDLAKIYATARIHAGARVGEAHEITELIVSLMARSSDNREVYVRQTITSKEQLAKNPPFYIPLRAGPLSATNTTNKLAGNYFPEGVRSAIVSPAERVESIEENLLR